MLAYMLVANGGGRALSTSKAVHVATSGGKVGNPSSVSVKKSSVSITINKTTKIKASIKKGKGKVRNHRKLMYESSNPAIATVSSKGVIQGKAKGTCYVFAYAQNGAFKRIKVTVKG